MKRNIHNSGNKSGSKRKSVSDSKGSAGRSSATGRIKSSGSSRFSSESRSSDKFGKSRSSGSNAFKRTSSSAERKASSEKSSGRFEDSKSTRSTSFKRTSSTTERKASPGKSSGRFEDSRSTRSTSFKRSSGTSTPRSRSSEKYSDSSESKRVSFKGGRSSSSDRSSRTTDRFGSSRGSKTTTKKAYGGADTFQERKKLSSIKDVGSEKEPKGRRTEKAIKDVPKGKSKFSKKSELKGFRPKFKPNFEEQDFRFLKPGSQGKKIDIDYIQETRKGGKSKEYVTQKELETGSEVRINRFISNAGVCSRREADELISAGLVTINGKVVTELGMKVKAGDVVRFNGEKLTVEAKVYILLNKPKDAITTAEDPDGRPTVMDLFEGKLRERVFPVGRLDRNTTGVLLLTNDGELAQRLMHPKYEIKKVYKATLNKNLKPADLWTLANGIELEDGMIKPDAIAQSDAKNKNVVGIEIHSGRNRIIHRMFEHLGYTVDKLDRVLYAGLEKGKLKREEWRELSEKEVKALKKSVHLK